DFHVTGVQTCALPIWRLRYEEAFVLQTALAVRRAEAEAEAATAREAREGGIRDAFTARLPFTLTEGQQEVVAEISRELARPWPIDRKSVVEGNSADVS